MAVVAPHVKTYAETVRRLQKVENLTPSERNKLNIARLKLAVWACRAEGLPPTLDNLRIVLGNDAQEAFSKLQQVVSEMGQYGPITRLTARS